MRWGKVNDVKERRANFRNQVLRRSQGIILKGSRWSTVLTRTGGKKNVVRKDVE